MRLFALPFRYMFIAGAVAGLALVGSSPAAAAPITFTFTGTATFVANTLLSTFSVGNAVSGSFTYDSTLLDTNVDANTGMYGPLSNLALTIGTYSPTFVNGSGYVRVINGPPGADQISFVGDVTGTPAGSVRPYRLSLNLIASSGLPLSSDALPLTLDSSLFPSANLYLSYTNRANPNDITTPGTNFTGVQATIAGKTSGRSVPEPAMLTLCAVGVLTALHRRRRQRQSATPSSGGASGR